MLETHVLHVMKKPSNLQRGLWLTLSTMPLRQGSVAGHFRRSTFAAVA